MRYFMVNYRKVAVKKGSKTELQMDEIVSVSKKVKVKDLQTASVILDFQKQQVLQSNLEGETIPRDWWTIRNFYHQHYKNLIEDLENFHGIKASEQVITDPDTKTE